MMEQQHPTPTLEETAIQELVSRLRGALLRPGDADYMQAARVYNAMISKQPALIARCVDVIVRGGGDEPDHKWFDNGRWSSGWLG